MTKILMTILTLITLSSVVFAGGPYKVTSTTDPAYFKADNYGRQTHQVFRTVVIHQPNKEGNPQVIKAWVKIGLSNSRNLDLYYSKFVEAANAHVLAGGTFILTRNNTRYAEEMAMARYSTLEVHHMFAPSSKGARKSTPLP